MSAVVDRLVTVRRTIAASPEDLFDAWIDPEAVAVWLCPGGAETRAVLDARVGGRFEITMSGERHGLVVHVGTYEMIDRPHKLVFSWASPVTDHRDTRVTVEFREVVSGPSPRTEVIVTHRGFSNDDARDKHEGGWSEAISLLERAFGPPRHARFEKGKEHVSG